MAREKHETWNRNREPRTPPPRKGDDIAERLEALAAAILDDLLPKLERRWASRHVGRQLARGATGAGSNYEEARGAESRADFAHKIGVATKELREARYWLHLSLRSRTLSHDLPDKDQLRRLAAEADELVAILTASGRTAKAGAG